MAIIITRNRVIGFVFGVIFLASFVTALIVGAIGVADGTDPKAHLSVTLEEWLLTYGAVGLVMMLFMVFDRLKKGIDLWTWLWGLLALFLVFPWLIVGQVILLQGTDNPQDGGEFGVGIWALVMSYLAAAAGFAGTSYLLGGIRADRI